MTAAGTKEAPTGADAYLHSLAYHQMSCSMCYHPRGDKVASSWGDFLWMASLALSGTSCDSTKQPQIWQCCSNPPVLLPPRRSVVCRSHVPGSLVLCYELKMTVSLLLCTARQSYWIQRSRAGQRDGQDALKYRVLACHRDRLD